MYIICFINVYFKLFFLYLSISVIFIIFTYLVPPRIAPFSFEEGPINSGDYASIQCTVPNGDLPINIEWTFNGDNFRQYAEIVVSKNGRRGSTLTIDSVSYSLAGNYTCIASNRAGYYQHTAQLLVNGYYIRVVDLAEFLY